MKNSSAAPKVLFLIIPTKKEVIVKKCSIIIANVTSNKNLTLLTMNTTEEKYKLTSCL